MSLYDGLDISDNNSGRENAPDVSGWGSSVKLMKSQKELNAKKQQSLMGGRKRHTTTVAPVVDLRGKKSSSLDGPVYFNQLTGRMEKDTRGTGGGGGAVTTTSPYRGAEAPTISSSFLGVSDEYDPLHPNDYEDHVKVVRERRQRERDEERKRELEEREKRRRERHAERGDRAGSPGSDGEGEFPRGVGPGGGPRGGLRPRGQDDPDDDEDDDEDEKEKRKYDRMGASGAAIAPPPSLMEDDSSNPDDGGPTGIGPGGFGFVGGSVAAKIMSRMGYKEGQGLGKKEQGMSMALQVEKIGKRSGKIIHEKDIPKFAEPKPPVSNAELLKNPSKVVLLRNMVGPGEVDDELEQETLDECQKYGKCLKCVIFEIPGAQDEEAVRIFIEFDKIDSGIKAIIDLNGRFFGGRSVKACFYNLDKFRRLDLADPVE